MNVFDGERLALEGLQAFVVVDKLQQLTFNSDDRL